MATELQSERGKGVVDWEKLTLALAIMVVLFVMLIVSFSQTHRDSMGDTPSVLERKYPNPELKAL